MAWREGMLTGWNEGGRTVKAITALPRMYLLFFYVCFSNRKGPVDHPHRPQCARVRPGNVVGHGEVCNLEIPTIFALGRLLLHI